MLVGTTVFQPILFAGQYMDDETTAWQNDGTTRHRPGLVLNGFRTYDPWVGSYLQVDPLVDSTWSSYVYVNSNPVGAKDPAGLSVVTGGDGNAYECSETDLGSGGTAWVEDPETGEMLETGIMNSEGHCDQLTNWGGWKDGGPNTDLGDGGGGGGGGGGGNDPPPPPPPPPQFVYCDVKCEINCDNSSVFVTRRLTVSGFYDAIRVVANSACMLEAAATCPSRRATVEVEAICHPMPSRPFSGPYRM